MSNSIPKITVPKGKFHLRRVNGIPSDPHKYYPMTYDAIERPFRDSLSEFVKLRTPHSFHPGAYPDVVKGLEVARSSLNYYSRFLRAMEIIENYCSFYLDRETLGAVLFLELPQKQFNSYIRESYFPWDKMVQKRTALRKALSIPFSGVRLYPLSATIDYQALMRRILFSSPEGSSDLFLAYLALELARLEEQGLSIMTGGYRKHILIGLAPMAERFDFPEIAELFRSEAFKRSEYGDRLNQIEDMRVGRFRNIANVQNHLDNLKEILAESLQPPFVRGIVEIDARVKGIYSTWEKRETRGFQPEDIRGIEIRVETLEGLWRVVEFLKKNFRKPTPKKFPELCRTQKEGKISFEKDDITHPRESGYSAYTLLLVDYAGETIEFKVTTFDRHRVNKEGDAAHWAYKAERSLKIFGLPAEQDFKAKDPEENKVLVLLGRSIVPDKPDVSQGYDIMRFKKGMRVNEMERELGGEAIFYRTIGKRLVTKNDPVEIEFLPGRINKKALLEDGMLFGHPLAL